MPILTSVANPIADDHDRADGGADHRDDVEQGDDRGERDGVLAEADQNRKISDVIPAAIATTKAPET